MGDSSRARSLTRGDFNNPGQAQNQNAEAYENEPGRQAHGSASQSSMSQAGQVAAQQFYHQEQAMRPEAFNMASLVTALPSEMSYQAYGQMPQQRYPQGHSPQAVVYPIQGVPHYAGPTAISPSSMNSPYNMHYPNQHQGMYAQGHPQDAQQVMGNTGNRFHANQRYLAQQQQQTQQSLSQQGSSPFFEQRSQFGQSQMYPGLAQIGQRSNMGDNRRAHQQGTNVAGGTSGNASSGTSGTNQSSVVRGPPRKPWQSGHAIWIGNLPPQTDLMSLVLHVCKETPGLVSLFLISKSNCAFANFKDEASCAAAQLKIHDSRFQTVRLVSRLRRSSGGNVGVVSAPTGPAALSPSEQTAPRGSEDDMEVKVDGAPDIDIQQGDQEESATPKDKFFIVKSLTVEDLELSVRNGIWATQSHNEESLNKAYQAASNVYLIFSANKSGEYFGYARMASPINDDPAAAIEFAPKAHAVEDPELPKATSTPATDFAPRGRIIDDSARGTIFWEAERDEAEDAEEEEEAGSTKSYQDPDSSTPSKAWGKPFKLEWISLTRLPFYRTRGLRNPWNSNREVKIARDGTELETAIGRRLIGLFHRSPSPPGPVVASMPQMQGITPPSMGGYPQMRPFQ